MNISGPDWPALRAALARVAAGVAVLSARAPDGREVTVTASCFHALSADPPLVLWTLPRSAACAPVFLAATHWTVHELAHGQAGAAVHAVVRFLCRSVNCHDGGDHLIMVGEVIGVEHCAAPPLPCHDSAYAIAGHADARPGAPSESPTAESFSFLLGSAFFYMYGQMRDACGKLGFNNIEVFVLMALGERGWRSRREIETLLSNSAQPTDLEVLDDLEARALLISREADGGAYADTEFALMPAGQAAYAQCNAVGQRIQQDVEHLLGASGSMALRALLRGFVERTGTSSGASWL